MELNRRRDLLGYVQTIGYLAVLVVTGVVAVWAVGRLAWPLVLLLFLVHGTCSSFLINGFHELVHDSVFKTRWLNRAFLWVFAYWGWYNHFHFWASHAAHHKYTLHPPDDLEVVLPTRIALRMFLRYAVVDLPGMVSTARSGGRWCLGRVQGEWESHLFPESDPVPRRRLSPCHASTPAACSFCATRPSTWGCRTTWRISGSPLAPSSSIRCYASCTGT